ncbi:MAG: diguanylate cyclase [Thermoleophilia bacterium]
MTRLREAVHALSLRWRILLPFVALCTVTWIVAASILSRSAEDLILTQGRAEASQAATAAARHIELRTTYLEREAGVLGGEAELIVGDRTAAEALPDYFADLTKAFTVGTLTNQPFFADMVKVETAPGKVLIDLRRDLVSTGKLDDKALFTEARAGKTASGIVTVSGRNKAYIAASVQISSGDPDGLVFLMGKSLDETVVSEMGLTGQHDIFIIGPNGVLAAGGPTANDEDLADRAVEGADGEIAIGDSTYILASAPISTSLTPGLRVVAALPTAPFIADAHAASTRAWLVLGVGLLLFVTVALILSTRITRPLAAVTAAARQLAAGHLDSRAPVHAGGEVGELAAAFNAMGDELAARDRRLSQVIDELKRLSETDPLTELLNHRAVHAAFERELSRAQRHNHTLGVTILDIDNFKLVNDTYGHAAGDCVLRQVTEALRANTRMGDVVGRHGGDEFMIILPETDADETLRVADKLRVAMHEHPLATDDGMRIPIRLSFGTATFPSNGKQINELLAYADANLYLSKRRGGDTVTRGDERDLPEHLSGGGFTMLDSLIAAVDNKDRYTRQHSEEVTRYALMLATYLDLGEGEKRILHAAGLLHDVGKIGVPDVLLRKPGRLADAEYEIVKNHAALGAALIQDIPDEDEVRMAIVAHHEHWDGSGFPAGLRGDEIPFLARILAVADAYSAMTSDRPYRKALTHEDALEQLVEASGTQLDPELAEAFVQAIAGAASPHQRVHATF